jgi:hypothetical protein
VVRTHINSMQEFNLRRPHQGTGDIGKDGFWWGT